VGYLDVLFFSVLKLDQKVSCLLIQSQKAVVENHRARPVLCVKLLSLCFAGAFFEFVHLQDFLLLIQRIETFPVIN